MRRHLSFLFIIFQLACILKATPTLYAGPIWHTMAFQQDQQNSANTAEAPAPGQETDDYSETAVDSGYTGEASAEEEAANNAPFPDIITPPEHRARDISNTQWAQLTHDKDFIYEDVKPKKETSGNGWWSKMFISLFEFLTSAVGSYMIIGIVVLIVIILIIRVVQLNGNVFFARRDRKLGPDPTDELSDEYMPDEWETVIRDAAKAGNYRLALRFGYRYLLSMLQEKGMISYQVAKTNYQYVHELAGTQLHQPFMQLTRDYEYAWYGGFPIQEERFEAYYRKVTDIKTALDQQG